MLAGKSGAAPITRFDATKFKTRFACELKNFDPHRYIPAKEARKMDPFTQYATIAADEAIADGGLRFDELDRDRIGVVVGSGIGGILSFTDEMKQFFGGDGTPRFSPFFIPRMIIDIAPGHVSIKHGLRGPNYACVAACATGTNCIIDAYMLIKNDLADVMVAGGGEAAVTEAGVGGFNALKALSEHNESPETASRPFDLDRNGFVLGEGAGALILEEYDHAVQRGAARAGQRNAGGVHRAGRKAPMIIEQGDQILGGGDVAHPIDGCVERATLFRLAGNGVLEDAAHAIHRGKIFAAKFR